MERACLFYFKDLNCLHVVNSTIVLKNFKINKIVAVIKLSIDLYYR